MAQLICFLHLFVYTGKKSDMKIIHHKVMFSYFSQHNMRITFREAYCEIMQHILQRTHPSISVEAYEYTHLSSTYEMYVSRYRQVRYVSIWLYRTSPIFTYTLCISAEIRFVANLVWSLLDTVKLYGLHSE